MVTFLPSLLASFLPKSRPLSQVLAAFQSSRTEVQWDSSCLRLAFKSCLSFLNADPDLTE